MAGTCHAGKARISLVPEITLIAFGCRPAANAQ
jgi:hypothetical protein